MFENLKESVCEANRELVRRGLVLHTFGNASGIDPSREHVVIKPSGVSYDAMKPEQMVVVSLETGKPLEGKLKPSSDTPTHLALYRAFPAVGGVVHTHSLYATAWAQARREIPCLGTTHADYAHGPIPCTRVLTAEEIAGDYEGNTGGVIVERLRNLNAMDFPGALVSAHGPFAWGATPGDAIESAAIIEFLARLACETLRIAPGALPLPPEQLDKHFFRKHGPDACYGQRRGGGA